MAIQTIADDLVAAAHQLRTASDQLRFGGRVACVYNPLVYAWPAHEAYLRCFGNSRKRVVFLGMNPGPFGMVQTDNGFQVCGLRSCVVLAVPD